jgi:hypothetical protein
MKGRRKPMGSDVAGSNNERKSVKACKQYIALKIPSSSLMELSPS